MNDLQKAHRLLAPRIAYLIGTLATDNTPNIIPVSNLTSISTAPQQIAVAVFKDWQTHRNLLKAPGFTVSVPDFNQLDGVWKLGAKYSRHDYASTADKINNSGLVISPTVSEFGPVLTDAIGWLTVRTLQRLDFAGDHTVFIAQVKDVWFNPVFLNPDGTPHGEVHPVMQVTGNQFTTAANSQTVPYFTQGSPGRA